MTDELIQKPSVRERVRNVLNWIGAIALFLAFQPYFSYVGGVTADRQVADYIIAHPGSMPFKEVYRFGWEDSPLIDYQSEQTLVSTPGGDISVQKWGGFTIGWLSYSSLTLAISLALFYLARALRLKDPPKTTVTR